MAFALHPLLSTYPGASFFPNGNLNGPPLALQSGGPSVGYWGYVPWETPEMPQWDLPPAIKAAIEGRGTGVYGLTINPNAPLPAAEMGMGMDPSQMQGVPTVGTGMGMGMAGPMGMGTVGGQRLNYGWPKYGPMPLRPELGGFVGKTNPFGRSFPHGFYKTTY
ncbi:hypothetical protein I316_03073 [Kwoniella heveanensis BCC8398]|uniref:Uncharacterized protein n=1 Tax=Kwoniella heveanensis BCC8398 TaxID=1296120 RepID=A0A1B9GVI1_9TREE|nr:hypothetical protein I316_03073 [Kwoniella heveanensis BCC8398]